MQMLGGDLLCPLLCVFAPLLPTIASFSEVR